MGLCDSPLPLLGLLLSWALLVAAGCLWLSGGSLHKSCVTQVTEGWRLLLLCDLEAFHQVFCSLPASDTQSNLLIQNMIPVALQATLSCLFQAKEQVPEL